MEKTKTSQPEYISNPFVQAYRAAKRLLSTNKRWAIFLIVVGVLGSLPQTNNSDVSSPSTDGGLFSSTTDTGTLITAIIFIVSLVLIVFVIGMVIATYFAGILSYVTLQSEKGKRAGFQAAVQATHQRFWRLLGAMLLAVIKILGWSLLFIVPGIIAAIRYALLSYVIMDDPAENQSVKESHDRVKQLTKGRLWEVFGISTTGFVPFAGTLLSTAGHAALYQQLKTYTDKSLEKPKIHWLNYFALIVCAVIIVLSIAITAALSINR